MIDRSIVSRTLVVFLLTLSPLAPEGARGQEQVAEIARAQELLVKARQAIGNPETLERLRTLSTAGTFRRFAKYYSVQSPTKVVEKNKVLSGKVQLEFVLPDKFRRRLSSTNLFGYRQTYTDVVNGDRAWRKPPPPVISSFRDSRVIDVGDIERSREKYADDARQQIAFYTLGWLLQTPASLPVEFIYAGEVQAEGKVLEAIVVKGPNGFRPVILFDRTTHLPFAIVVTYVESKRETVVVEAASVSRLFIQQTNARARREREARRRSPQRRELQWRFEDHQLVAGLQLPHRITTVIDGEILEQLTINEFKINHEIDSKRFEGHPEVR